MGFDFIWFDSVIKKSKDCQNSWEHALAVLWSKGIGTYFEAWMALEKIENVEMLKSVRVWHIC